MDTTAVETEVRAICLAFPEATERFSHGTPSFFVGRLFVTLWPEGHHHHDFPHLWCAASAGAQEELIASSPERIFRPPYVGHRGWLGVRLDGDVDWTEVAEFCEDAYRTVAPKRLIAALLQSGGEGLLPGPPSRPQPSARSQPPTYLQSPTRSGSPPDEILAPVLSAGTSGRRSATASHEVSRFGMENTQ